MSDPRPRRVHTSVWARIRHSVQTRLDTLKTHQRLSRCLSPRRSRMFQELYGSQRRHQDAGLPRQVPQQPGLHLHDLRPQDVRDRGGVRQLRHGARHHAAAGRPLPIRLAGDLGRLPCRWGDGVWLKHGCWDILWYNLTLFLFSLVKILWTLETFFKVCWLNFTFLKRLLISQVLFFFPALFSKKESGGMIDEDGCTTNIERGMSDRKKGWRWKKWRRNNRAASPQVERWERGGGGKKDGTWIKMPNHKAAEKTRRMRRAGDDFSPADVDRKQTEMQTETCGGDGGGGGGGRRTKDGWLPCRWDRLGLSDGGEGESRGEK